MSRSSAKSLLLAGKTAEAIAAARRLDLSKAEERALSLIEAESNQLHRQILNGTINEGQQRLIQNQINARLLDLLSGTNKQVKSSSPYKYYGLGLLLLLATVITYGIISIQAEDKAYCPTFPAEVNNRILLFPFSTLDGSAIQPQLLLRDRIEALTLSRGLSTSVRLSLLPKDISLSQAPEIARACDANVIVWGKHAIDSDSLSIILQYHFLEAPELSQMSQLSRLKDVTEIRSGTISHHLEDAILLLCGLIAIHEGQPEAAQEWLKKIKQPKEMEQMLLAKLRSRD